MGMVEMLEFVYFNKFLGKLHLMAGNELNK